MKILIVDDEEGIRSIIKEYCEEEGYEVEEAETGKNRFCPILALALSPNKGLFFEKLLPWLILRELSAVCNSLIFSGSISWRLKKWHFLGCKSYHFTMRKLSFHHLI